MSLNRCPRCGECLEKSSGSPFRDAAKFIQNKLNHNKGYNMKLSNVPNNIKMFISFLTSFIFMFSAFAVWDVDIGKYWVKTGSTAFSIGMFMFFALVGFSRIGDKS